MRKTFLAFPLLFLMVGPLTSTYGVEKEGDEEMSFFIEPNVTSGRIMVDILRDNHDTVWDFQFPASLTEQVPSEHSIFKEIKVSGGQGSYQIKGLCKPTNRHFFYTVEDGHHEYIRETKVDLGEKNQEWSPFSIVISIPSENLLDNGTFILNLYERNEKGGIINSYPVILEKFYP
jgi:hypothetical protein